MDSKPFFAYRSFWKQPETVRRFYDAGIRQFCVFPANTTNSIGEPYCQYPTNWKWYDKYDFSVVDAQFDDLLAVAPGAEILCIIDLNSPDWLVKNLNVRGVFADSFLALSNALAADPWINATENYLRALLSHIEERYGDRVRSYLLAAGTTDEWMDYSKGVESIGKLERYRDWCRQRGLDEPEAIPDYNCRFHSSHGPCLRDPQNDRAALQYWRFHSDLVADGIIHFCDLVRSLVPPARKIGVFYGYILQLAHQRLVQCGHLAYEKVLAAASVDFVTSPGIYDDRSMGGGGGFMNVNGTVKLHGKNYFHELDHATHSSNWQLNEYVSLDWMVNWPDEKASIAGLRREFCRSLLHGTSLWWFDMWGGFFDSAKTVDEIGKFRRLWEDLADYSNDVDAEIAIIVDPESTYYLQDSCNDPVMTELFTGLLRNCNRLGTSYKIFSFNDIPAIPDISKYKMIILPGVFEITSKKHEVLAQYILKHSRTVIWTYGAGLSNGLVWSPAAMKALTGAEFEQEGTVISNMGDWKSVYMPTTDDMTPEILRDLAVTAGVHLYTERPTPVFANERYVMVHVASSGKMRIRLKRPAQVRELLNGTFSLPQCRDFVYDFDGPETVLFQLE